MSAAVRIKNMLMVTNLKDFSYRKYRISDNKEMEDRFTSNKIGKRKSKIK